MAGSPDVKSDVPYAAEINAAAHRYGLRPALLAGLIQQESQFNPTIVSPAGAQGLTQLMPDTAKELGVTKPLDPVQSIDGGAKYLAQQMRHFKNDESLALAAYNAGPGNVEKFHGIPPFKETQNYVPLVLGNATAFENGTPFVARSHGHGQTMQVGSHGADVTALQRELGVTPDGRFGPKTEAAVRAFQVTHGLKADGVVGRDTHRALAETAHEKLPEVPVDGRHPANGRTVAAVPTKDETTMQAFQKTWEANATVNPRTKTETLPALSATLDQKNNTLELHFRDKAGVVQTATMNVKETSSGRYDAAHILPGKYQLGNFSWSPTGAITQGHGLTKNDIAYGAADIPITMRDGHDAVPVVLKDGQRVSTTQSDGKNERFHGGGSGLAKPFEPHQPLTGTHGCVRGENEDVAVVAGMIERSGKPVALTITRDTRSQKHEVQRSSDGGKTWQDVTDQTKIVGALHDAADSNVVSIVTRGGNPPTTVTFKPEQLGFTKQQIEDIAARDPKGRIAIGLDQFHQPVVNAMSDLARSGEAERPSPVAHR